MPFGTGLMPVVTLVFIELPGFDDDEARRMRFGIGMREHTLEQVGKTLGVTRERIRQIEAKALQKLSHPARAGKLLSFTES